MRVFCIASLYLCALCILPAQSPSNAEAFDPIRAAEDEARRRAETRMIMDLNLKRAEEHRKSKRYPSAAFLYEQAIGLAHKLGNVKAVEKDVAKAREGIVYSRLRLARELQDQDLFKEADQEAAKALAYDPDNSRLRKFRKSNEEVRKAHIGRIPSREVRMAIQSHRNSRAKVLTLLRDGKAYFEAGQMGEAEKRLTEAVRLEPQSDVAYYYLSLILEGKHDREGRARDHTFQKRVLEIAKDWNR